METKLIYKILTLTLSVLLLTGCDNENTFDCIKKRGDESSIIIPIDKVSTIRVYDGVNLTIEESTESSVTVTTGKNLISKIDVFVDSDTLYLRDNNTCNWVRKYQNPEITVKVPPRSLDLLEQFGYGTIQTENRVHINSFRLNVQEGSGDVDIEMDGYIVLVVSSGVNQIKLRGETPLLMIGMYYNDGILDASEMLTENVEFTHQGANKIIINPYKAMIGEIKSTGNVYYNQIPDSTNVIISGQGQLLPLNP